MQAAGLDLVTGYLPNQPLSDAAGQALGPMGPALMTHPHVTPERSPHGHRSSGRQCTCPGSHTVCVLPTRKLAGLGEVSTRQRPGSPLQAALGLCIHLLPVP